eukprot:10162452-Alexandrium_andersonii.AAC.1
MCCVWGQLPGLARVPRSSMSCIRIRRTRGALEDVYGVGTYRISNRQGPLPAIECRKCDMQNENTQAEL